MHPPELAVGRHGQGGMGAGALIQQADAAQHQIALGRHVAHGDALGQQRLGPGRAGQVVPAGLPARPGLARVWLAVGSPIAPGALGRLLAGAQQESFAAAGALDLHLSHGRPGRQSCAAGQVAPQPQAGGLQPSRVRYLYGLARLKLRAQLQVVVDAIPPDIEGLVGDDVRHAQQAQQAAGGHALQLLAQAAILGQRARRDEEGLQIDVATQRQHPAVVAIDGRQPPQQRQVGRDDLLQLVGHRQVVDGRLRQIGGKDLLHLRQVARVVGDAGDAEEAAGWPAFGLSLARGGQ